MANELPEAPEIRVPVIDAEGNAGSLPQSQIQDAVFKDKLFTLAPVSPIKSQDIGQDGRINVIDPNGQAGTLPLTDLNDALKSKGAGGGGFRLQSDFDRANDPLVKQKYDQIKKSIDTPTSPLASKGGAISQELIDEHKSDKVLDSSGNYIMSLNGHDLSVPKDEVYKAQAAGYQFKDENFQALTDAYRLVHKEKANSNTHVDQFADSFASAIPLYDKFYHGVQNLGLDVGTGGNATRAEFLSTYSPEIKEEYKDTRTAGTVAGIGAQLLAPEGLLGEVALAGKAAKAIKAAKVLEETPVLASVLSHAVQGMVISAPQTADALISNNPKLAAESLGLGALGGVIFGGLPDLINKASGKIATMAEERVANKALSSIGANAENDLLKLDQHVKNKLLDTLTEAGLKESSNAENTLKVLGKVSSGEGISVLGKLDQLAGEKVLTGNLANELTTMVRGEGGLNKITPELEAALTTLNQKMEKVFPEGSGSLEKVQKIVSDLSEDLSKVKLSSEVSKFNTDARDLIMNEIYKVGDQAVLKADAKTVALWTEQKAMTQAASQLQGGFKSQLALAEQAGIKAPQASNLFKDLALATVGHIPVVGHAIKAGAHLMGVGHLPTFTSIAAEQGKSIIGGLLSGGESAGKGWLLKNADNPNIGSYLAINAVHNTNFKVGQIPEFIKNPAIKTTLFANNSEPIKSLLGSESNGLSKSQQFDKLSNKISMLAGNEQLRDNYLNQVTSVVAKNHPELAQGLKQELTNKIMATNQLLHDKNQTQPQAFQGKTKYTPSKEKMAEIEAGLNAIENPYSILSGLKDGKVSSKQVELVKQTHPAIYQEMSNQINKEAYSGETKLNYQQRLSASIITGQPMDQSLKIGQALQATYANGEQPQQGGPPPKGKKSGSKNNIHTDKVSSYTTAQRLSK